MSTLIGAFAQKVKRSSAPFWVSSVKNAVGLDNLADPRDQDYPLFTYLASAEAKLDKLYEVPELLRTPIVRNGKQATVGFCPEVWKDWK